MKQYIVDAFTDKPFSGNPAAVCVMGLAGEIGYANLRSGEGSSTLRNRIIDAICNMDAETLNKGAKYEMR